MQTQSPRCPWCEYPRDMCNCAVSTSAIKVPHFFREIGSCLKQQVVRVANDNVFEALALDYSHVAS